MPRRENSPSAGLVATSATFESVRVGTLIQGVRGTLDDVWECIEMRNPAQHTPQHTPWMLFQKVGTTERFASAPRGWGLPVKIMVPEDQVDLDKKRLIFDKETAGPHTQLSDQEAVNLLVVELGATDLAYHDRETGIVMCPPYEGIPGGTVLPSGRTSKEEHRIHMEVMHGIAMSDFTGDYADLVTLHGQSHDQNPKRAHIGKGGIPHQHAYPSFR